MKRGKRGAGQDGGGAPDRKKKGATPTGAPSPELQSLVYAAEQAFSNLMALFAAYASAPKVQPASASEAAPEWIGEADVANMAGVSPRADPS